jgi:hypothetical protein
MANNNPLRYPLDESDYRARVVFRIKEDESTSSASNSALKGLISQNQNKIKKLEEQFDQIKSELSSEELSQAQYEEQLNSIRDQIRTLKDEIRQWEGLANQPKQASTIPVEKEVIDLYLPMGLAYRDNVTYENFDLGGAGAAMEAGLGFAESMMKGTTSMIKNITGGASGESIARLAGVQLASKFGSFGAEAAAVQKLAGGVTLNPNSRVLFKQPNIREFAFTFKFVAKSADEAYQVNQIIKTFRRELYPASIDVPAGDQTISLGYIFPKKFDITFLYAGQEIPNLAKIKPCYLRDVSTTYNASQMAMHSDGNFLEVDMTLSFQETKALTRADVEAGY